MIDRSFIATTDVRDSSFKSTTEPALLNLFSNPESRFITLPPQHTTTLKNAKILQHDWLEKHQHTFTVDVKLSQK